MTKILTTGYKTPTTDEINALMKAAHRERARYVAELFGFGFATAQKGLAGFTRPVEDTPDATKTAAGCA